MNEIALRTIGLGKMYLIGGEKARYRTLRDTIAQTAKRPIERIRHPGAATHVSQELWALKDIDLEVRDGEVLGIIGRNGAGKTTLLKILSRITEPTEGRAEIRGRVASLLEVGTGFHSELTGRENIYLNGAILGMSRAEIKRRFDEIVEFSEVGRFLDTPVKRYSSGMYVRLAFSVAAHLEPEILVVDEVLAVGDASFQKKCLGKMGNLASGGRTVLFVSHNMQAVSSLCESAVLIDGGRIATLGEAKEVVAHYLARQADSGASISWESGKGPGDDEVRLTSVQVLDPAGNIATVVSTAKPFVVRFEFDLARLDEALCIGFDLAASDGTIVMRSYQTDVGQEEWPALRLGRNSIGCTIPAGLLNEGDYFVMPRVSLHCVRWIVNGDSVISFRVHRDPGPSPYTLTHRPGAIAPMIPWQTM
jgi:lipopolysaccharide transport system ATP-binding protein